MSQGQGRKRQFSRSDTVCACVSGLATHLRGSGGGALGGLTCCALPARSRGRPEVSINSSVLPVVSTSPHRKSTLERVCVREKCRAANVVRRQQGSAGASHTPDFGRLAGDTLWQTAS